MPTLCPCCLSAFVKVFNATPRSLCDLQENAEQAVREMLQQFSHDRGLPEVPSPLLHLLEAVATLKTSMLWCGQRWFE